MKNKESIQSEVHGNCDSDGNLKIPVDYTSELGKRTKKIFYFSVLLGIGFLLKSCVPGYVSSEPSYSEGIRPSQPSNLHVWVDGDWAWSRQSHTYVHNNGYWSHPRQGRTFVTGHWQSGPRGHSWTRGSWQKQARTRDNSRH